MRFVEPVPYFCLKKQFSSVKSEWLREIGRLGDSANFILGDAVAELETQLAQFIGTKHAITVSSGTDALVLALKAAGVRPGDSVIVADFTFFASVEAVSLVGATPKLVDIHLSDFNIDPQCIESAIDDSTRAILPVHLFGAPAAIDEINKLAERYNIPVIEDAAQSFGAKFAGAHVGTTGQSGCFSFYPTKIIGAFGDGGMVVTDDDDIANQIRLLRNHGITGPNQHDLIGHTSRLDAIQAAVLKIKLKTVSDAIDRRKQLASYYLEQLKSLEIDLPSQNPNTSHAYNVFTIRSRHRDKIAEMLKSRNIGYQIYYPQPIHRQKPYHHLNLNDDDFPNSHQAASTVISLPLYPEMPDEHVTRVTRAIQDALD